MSRNNFFGLAILGLLSRPLISKLNHSNALKIAKTEKVHQLEASKIRVVFVVVATYIVTFGLFAIIS